MRGHPYSLERKFSLEMSLFPLVHIWHKFCTFGIGLMKVIFSSVSRDASKTEIRDAFLSTYGMTIEDTEQDRLSFIG